MKRLTIFSLVLLLLCSFVLGEDPNPKFAGEIEITPATPKVDDNIKFKVRFRLKLAPVQNLKIVGKIDNSIVWTKNIPSLSAPQDYYIEFVWKATTQGSHKAAFEIDPDNTIQEFDENDNYVEKTFTVAPGSGSSPSPSPGVSVQRVPEGMTKVKVRKPLPSSGGSVQKVPEGMNKVKVRKPLYQFKLNLVAKEIRTDMVFVRGGFRRYFYIDMEVQGKEVNNLTVYFKATCDGKIFEKTKSLENLAVGPTTISFTGFQSLTIGDYLTYAAIDPDNLLKEENRYDNYLMRPIKITQQGGGF